MKNIILVLAGYCLATCIYSNNKWLVGVGGFLAILGVTALI